MAICSNCGGKIGLFQAKHKHQVESGEKITVCSECNILRLKEENRKRVSQIKPLLNKYFSNCDIRKQAYIGNIYSDNKLYVLLEDDNLDYINNHVQEKLTEYREMTKNATGNDLETLLGMIDLLSITELFLVDLEKLYRIICKKDVFTTYPELIQMFHDLLEDEIYKENLNVTKAEFVRISNILKEDISVRNVIKELIKSPTKNIAGIEGCKLMLDKFNLIYQEAALPSLIEELTEEVDLEDFEENLGGRKRKVTLPDYTLMNGPEFENFLKEVFESLGYTVVQTKLSGDQGADHIIMKDNVKTVVQAKKYIGKVSNKAIQEVVAAKMFYNCENAMVVTTGEFTKSAIQLALSNNVELWNNNKLESVVSNIENYSDSTLYDYQSIPHTFDKLPISCPYCKTAFEIPVTELPEEHVEMKITCPGCSQPLSFEIPSELYVCPFCNDKFELVKDCRKHAQNCDEAKGRHFKCKSCSREFVLDDDDVKELSEKGSVDITCNGCKNVNTFTSSD